MYFVHNHESFPLESFAVYGECIGFGKHKELYQHNKDVYYIHNNNIHFQKIQKASLLVDVIAWVAIVFRINVGITYLHE